MFFTDVGDIRGWNCSVYSQVAYKLCRLARRSAIAKLITHTSDQDNGVVSRDKRVLPCISGNRIAQPS